MHERTAPVCNGQCAHFSTKLFIIFNRKICIDDSKLRVYETHEANAVWRMPISADEFFFRVVMYASSYRPHRSVNRLMQRNFLRHTMKKIARDFFFYRTSIIRDAFVAVWRDKNSIESRSDHLKRNPHRANSNRFIQRFVIDCADPCNILNFRMQMLTCVLHSI